MKQFKSKKERQQIIDKLCQYDVYLIMKDINHQDYGWLSEIREFGFKGYANYTDKELINEWENFEDLYNSMIADNIQKLYETTNTKSVSRVPNNNKQDENYR